MTTSWTRRDFLALTGSAGAALLFPPVGSAADAWAQVPGILARIVPPVFPARDFPVTRFGAVGDGKTDCTGAFRDAIAACQASGGGRVVVPEGSFLTGAIRLKSGVNLHLAAPGSVITFSRDPRHFLPVVFTRWEGVECMNYSALIYAFEERNIAVTGSGTLDGQASAEYWWPWKGNKAWPGAQNQNAARARLIEMGAKGVPAADRVFGEGGYLRPNFIQPYRCQNVLIEGVKIRNSPMWEIHPVLCANVTVRGVDILSHGPNNDGCDPESCNNVLIEKCAFDTGDDCIAIKSGRNEDGRRVNIPAENIIVRDCVMKDGHGGVVIGSEISGGARNIFAERCRMDSPQLDRALRIKSNSVRGGTIEHVYMRDVTVGQVAEAVVTVDFFYEEGDAGGFPPVVRDVEIRNVTGKKSQYVLLLRGYAHDPVSDVRVVDCSFEDVAKPDVLESVRDVVFANVKVNGTVRNEEDHAVIHMTWLKRRCVSGLVPVLIVAGAAVAAAQLPPGGRADPSFTQPSIAPGVDYTVPTEAEVKAVLDRIRDHFVRSTPYAIVDTATGTPITDFTRPVKTAGIDTSLGEFNDWTYSMGVVLAAMLQVTDVTGDKTFAAYALKNFDFIFDHIDYFRRQAQEFGPQPRGYRRLIEMRELDDCGAIGAALVKAYAVRPDPRYREGIALVDEHIGRKQPRLKDGTLARPRPVPVALWIDDAYMSIPFLAQMGKFTGERRYFDDAARQVAGMSQRMFDARVGLYDHSWFENAPVDGRFFWGRGAGWMLMAMAELLSVMPADHPDRAKVLDQFERSVQGVAAMQGGTGMWHQLVDKTDSYLESSATAMYTFAIARGVNRGWISTAYAPVAQSGWRALEQRVRADGQIEGICVGTTAAYDMVYYYNRPTRLDAMQGYGPALMAGAEVMTMLRSFEIRRANNTFYYFPKQK